MTKRSTRKPLARTLYIDGFTLHEAARKADVSLSTIQRWKLEDSKAGDGSDWDAQRAVRLLEEQASDELARANLHRFERQCALVLDDMERDTGLTALERLKALTGVQWARKQAQTRHGEAVPGDLRRAVAKTVLVKLGNFLHARYPQHVAAYLEFVEPFREALEQDHA